MLHSGISLPHYSCFIPELMFHHLIPDPIFHHLVLEPLFHHLIPELLFHHLKPELLFHHLIPEPLFLNLITEPLFHRLIPEPLFLLLLFHLLLLQVVCLLTLLLHGPHHAALRLHVLAVGLLSPLIHSPHSLFTFPAKELIHLKNCVKYSSKHLITVVCSIMFPLYISICIIHFLSITLISLTD